MGALLITKPLPLLLLLLQPLPFQSLLFQYVSPPHYDFPDEKSEEVEDYIDEVYATGPTKPPTEEIFQRQVIIDHDRSLDDPQFCNGETKMKIVHNRLSCVKEHFFLKVSYRELKQSCNRMFTACNNGVKRCHRTWSLIEGVYCKLTAGTRMPDCEFTSFHQKGYALITCRWEDKISETIPYYVNGILEVSGK